MAQTMGYAEKTQQSNYAANIIHWNLKYQDNNGQLDICSQAIYLQSLVIPVSPNSGYFQSIC